MIIRSDNWEQRNKRLGKWTTVVCLLVGWEMNLCKAEQQMIRWTVKDASFKTDRTHYFRELFHLKSQEDKYVYDYIQ